MSAQQLSLWSSIAYKDNKRGYLCPPELEVSLEDFLRELSNKLATNKLPANATITNVTWDDKKEIPLIVVQFTGNDPSIDYIYYLIGVDQLGSFTFITERVCYQPPVLPVFPRKSQSAEKPYNNPLWIVIAGVITILIGPLIDYDSGVIWVCLPVGFLLVLVGVLALGKYNTKMDEWEKIARWNEMAKEEENRWLSAWNEWATKVVNSLKASRQDDTLGRYLIAISETVNQVVKVLFEDRNAELKEQKAQARTQQEIEDAISERKNDLFR